VTLIRRAAPLTLPVSMTALKTSMWRRRMGGSVVRVQAGWSSFSTAIIVRSMCG
jgi:hypothetical protein